MSNLPFLDAQATPGAAADAVVALPVQAPHPSAPPLVERLVEQCGASWVDETTVQAWSALGGDRVVLLAGDPVRFPEGLDVAVVLPELQRCLGGSFAMAAVPRAHEDAVARRYGSQRWPSLLFLRDGQYVTTLAGMHDWDVFLDKVRAALALPVSPMPGMVIPLIGAAVADDSGAGSCH